MRFSAFIFLFFSTFSLLGQWFDPIPYLEGQAWSEESGSYERLPARAEKNVSEAIWNLQKQSAGLMFRFRSNAPEIVIQYVVENENYAFNHMSSTGKSGVDLYAITREGEEKWCAAGRQFGDTITYTYRNLDTSDRYHNKGKEYRLYLPLYNEVNWMRVGVDKDQYFEALNPRNEQPIAVYGTSIAQGACASRPGMAWTAQLGRRMDRPVINLGFSGNGLLDPYLVDLMAEIDAKIYILDCLPNLSLNRWKEDGIDGASKLYELVWNAVVALIEKRPDVPILLVDHAGYTEAGVSALRKEEYESRNRVQHKAYIDLKEKGYKDLHYLSHDELNLSLDAMVDGVHPTDLGMTQYADAYEEIVRKILKEPKGMVSTTIPVTQYREPDNYEWFERHRAIKELNQNDPPNFVFLANSIVHFWGGEPKGPIARENESWEKDFTPKGLRNLAYGWDRIENVLWRVYHGELDGFQAEKVLVMIGTNNLHINSDEEILEGLEVLIDAIKVRQAKAEVIIMGLLPRRDYVERLNTLNSEIEKLSIEMGVEYRYIGSPLVDKEGRLKENLFLDGLHPNEEGYRAIGPMLYDILVE